jgi:membrane protein YqaA with SNARE-associated domain
MRFKTGLILGAAAGYVLGAKAGRERYMQIKNAFSQAQGHPAMKQVTDQLGGVTEWARGITAGGLQRGSRRLSDYSDLD